VPFNNVFSGTEYILGTNYRTKQYQVLSFKFNIFPDFLLSLVFYRSCVGPLVSFLNRQSPSSCPQLSDYKDMLLKLFGREQIFFHKTFFNNEINTDFFRFFLGLSQNWEKRILASSCLSVRLSAWYNWASTGRIFMKILVWVFFENLLRIFKFIKIGQE
jgi:hypothetical protein